MRKPAAIAIFAASGIVLIQPAYSQDPNGRPIALIPAMVPPAVAAFGPAPSHSVAGARPVLQRAVKGTYPATHYQRGMYLKQRGDLDGALIEFLKSAQENPMNVNAFYEQAVIFRARGYTKLAQSALQQALAVKPDYRDARMLLASVHLDDGQLSQAANELLKSLGINGLGGAQAQKSKAAPVTESTSNYGLMPPSLIQTPHGKLRVPAAPPVVSPTPLASLPAKVAPKADPFAHKPVAPVDDIGELLRGIPGFGGTKEPEDNLADLPNVDDAPGLTASNGSTAITPDMVARQVEAVEQAAHPSKRRKKRRVAAWLDAFLDRTSTGGGAAEPEVAQAPTDPPSSQSQLNPLKMIEAKRFSKMRAETNPQIAEAPDTPAPIMPPTQPYPVEFVRRALSFVPLPIFKAPKPPLQPNVPKPGSIEVAKVAPAPPAAPTPGGVALPTLARQSKLSRGQITPAPASETSDAPIVAVPAPRELEHDNFMAVLAGLPKHIARSVEQVFKPKPVDITAQPGAHAAPELAPVGRVAPAPMDPSLIPAPSNAVAPRLAYNGNLVEAQVAPPPPSAPMPVRPDTGARVAGAPTPLAGARVAEMAPPPAAPAPSGIRMPAGAAPAPSGAVGGTAQTPVVAPMGPTTRGATVAMAAPVPVSVPLSASAAGTMPAPQPINASRAAAQFMPAPLPGVAGANAAPVPNHAKSSASAPPVMPVTVNNGVTPPAVPAPIRATATVIPPSEPMPPAELTNSPVARRLASQGFKFVAPKLASGKPLVLTAIKTAPKIAPLSAAPTSSSAAKSAAMPDDEYARRMKYLLEHGTASLAPGEAFMFSEETGEGVLFMHHGTSVRRKIAQARDHEEVARLRRPDILGEDGELRYNLSLLGKIIKPAAKTSVAQPPPKAAGTVAAAPPRPQSAQPAPGQNGTEFNTTPILPKDDNLFGWLKNVFKF